MKTVRLTVLESACRSGYHRKGDCFWVDDLCPPLCHELWHAAYPMIYTLQNGGSLDLDNKRGTSFTVSCPDGGRVTLYGEAIDKNNQS